MADSQSPRNEESLDRSRELFARGRSCAAGLPKGLIDALLECRLTADDSLAAFAEEVNSRGIWPVGLAVVDGALEVRYPRCLCHRLPPEPDERYCECSRGWLTELLERVFERPFSVELLASILRGDEECRLLARPVWNDQSTT